MKRVKYSFSLLIFSLLVVGCDSTKIESTTKNKKETGLVIAKVKVPEDTVFHSDSRLVRNENGQITFEGNPFSGHLIQFFRDTRFIQYDKSYIDGWQHGWALAFYRDGAPMYKRWYEQGKKHGKHLGWYRNGQLNYERYFDHGINTGNHKTWYKSGQLYKDQNYKNGHEFGPQKVYRPDGKFRGNYVVREDGRKFGLLGLKRCEQVETNEEKIKWKALRNRDSIK